MLAPQQQIRTKSGFWVAAQAKQSRTDGGKEAVAPSAEKSVPCLLLPQEERVSAQEAEGRCFSNAAGIRGAAPGSDAAVRRHTAPLFAHS